jgi:hypothetical protein
MSSCGSDKSCKKKCKHFVQVTALGAAVAAGSSLGIWTVGAKMDGITVYRYVQ